MGPIDPAFGQRLRELRTERGMSLAELAKASHYSKGYLSQLESATRRASADVAAKLDGALSADGQLATLAKPEIDHSSPVRVPADEPAAMVQSGNDTGWGGMLRRTALLSPAAMAVHRLLDAAIPYLEPPNNTGIVGDETAVGLAEVAAQYRRSYHAVPASRLLQAALAHLDLVMSLRPGQQPARQKTTLLRAAGEMAALAGALLGIDAQQQQPSMSYLDLAWSAARATSDIELQAVVLGGRSFMLSYRGDHREGLECADFARDVAATGASARTRAWVAAAASERCASLGDVAGCQERLDESRAALDGDDDGTVWRGIGGFNADKLTAYKGGDMVRLGRYDDALPILDSALNQLDDSMHRHRASALVDRAEARLGAQDVDAACEDALAALQLVAQVQHAGNLNRVESLAEKAAASGARAGRALRREVQLTRADNGLPTRWES